MKANSQGCHEISLFAKSTVLVSSVTIVSFNTSQYDKSQSLTFVWSMFLFNAEAAYDVDPFVIIIRTLLIF